MKREKWRDKNLNTNIDYQMDVNSKEKKV